LLLYETRIPEWIGLVSVLVPSGVAWALTALLIRLAPRLGLVDLPSPRKVHVNPTPRGGGLAIFFAVLGTVALVRVVGPWAEPRTASGLDPRIVLRWPAPWDVPWLLATVLFLLGLADDLRPLAWPIRLLVHAGVAGAAVVWWKPDGSALEWGAAAVWLVAMINAFNMLDNMDLLAAGVACITAFFLVAGQAMIPQSFTNLHFAPVLPLLMLMGALLGFARYNYPPARIFMGDAGSTFLGFVIGMGTLEVDLQAAAPSWGALIAACTCAVPIYDQLSVVILRISQGKSPFHADRQHLSHRLTARGFSPIMAVRLIHVLALVSGSVGMALYFADGWTTALALAGGLAVAYAALALYEWAPFARSVEHPAPACPAGEGVR
jgi:UDP-GlcNAc:undecaprenyl-phosphate GlcNAc-1-phosphate transferase